VSSRTIARRRSLAAQRQNYHQRILAAQRRRTAALLLRPRQIRKLRDRPGLLLQAVVIPKNSSSEGQLIEAVALPWFEIVKLLERSPNAVHEIDWRKWEEIIARRVQSTRV
jgi:hypothetical protein